MAIYIALVHKEKDSAYGVSFPDFPGCISAGDTLEEAASNAKEALQFHIEGLVEDNEKISEPSQLDQVMAAPESRSAAVLMVEVEVPEDKAERINITVPARKLKVIDAHAGGNRSEFLVRAAEFYIHNYEADGVAEQLAAARVHARRTKALMRDLAVGKGAQSRNATLAKVGEKKKAAAAKTRKVKKGTSAHTSR
jgi:predicted RNase H-like HicB family nuclease